MKIYITFFLILISISLYAESMEKAQRAYNFNIALSYYGDFFTHPGTSLDIEFIPFQSYYNKFVLKGNFSFYIHPLREAIILINSDIGYRFVSKPGFFFDCFAGIGYLHSFLASPLINAVDYGRPAFIVNTEFGLGWDFSRLTVVPLTLFARADIFGEYPYNNIMLIHFVFKAGISYKIKLGNPKLFVKNLMLNKTACGGGFFV